jgi:hypothetical protein
VTWLEVEGIGVFFTTAGDDCAVHLWSKDGQHVGEFGPNVWVLEDRSTWASLTYPPDGDFQREVQAEAEAPIEPIEAGAQTLEAVEPEALVPVKEEPSEATLGTEGEETTAVDDEEEEEAETTPGAEKTREGSTHETFVMPTAPDPEQFRALAVEMAEAKRIHFDEAPPAVKPVPRPPSPTPSEAELNEAYPTRDGYRVVQPDDDRPRWTTDVDASFESGATYARIQRMDSRKVNDLRRKSKEELQALEAKLSAPKPERHERVYIPAGDMHINNPEGKGRAFTSLYHLVKIRDVHATKPRPETNVGAFKYGERVEDVMAKKEAARRAKNTRRGSTNSLLDLE